MDKYVCSRELAEKLKAAGYPQKSTCLIWWHPLQPQHKLKKKEWFLAQRTPMFDVDRGYSIAAAPLTDELLEQLPDKIDGLYVKLELKWLTKHGPFMAYMAIERLNPMESKIYGPDFNAIWRDASDDDAVLNKPADALAELWLWAKEKGLL